ncbi:RecQ family ATP-dependent DNA helicase [Frankia sp. QA3]|uniref:RecQ family ATP-dependent DNA helicase n=1 Tax=Frankia sp. QA3 TaxID=710111 RepID=UPI000269C6F6|nr:DEAD/DEAH box helicase [Frankia sp. QA3]EIV94041.1 superfamily II DNA helicase [Frankia sp. QA3]
MAADETTSAHPVADGSVAATGPQPAGASVVPQAAPAEASAPAAGGGALRARAQELLRALAGPAAVLREDQWQAIDALVTHRRRVLLVQRTGWGKSAVYFLATALLRGEAGLGPVDPGRRIGPTVIVSPLLALIRNQAAAAGRLGIRAGEIHSGNVTEWDEVYAALRAGELDVLLVGPERLNNPTFRDDYLPELAATTGLLVVDEAHCISDWGHDFRPDYRRLRTLIAGLRPQVPVLATTATANQRVVEDVSEQLDAGAGAGAIEAPGTLVLRGSLDRESLRLAVVALPRAEHRFGWLAERLRELPGSGIVYTLTKAAAEELTAFLRGEGYPVACYHGGTEAAERVAAEEDLLANRVKALVATSALGMGFDKPDLGFVVHVGAPSSPISYYQQIGRAGRAVDAAEVVLLPAAEDRDIWRYFADTSFPPERVVRAVLGVLADADRPMSTQALLAAVDLGPSRLDQMLKVLDTDGVVHRVKGGWTATGAAWSYDEPRYRRVAAARAVEQQAMLDYIATPGCRMEFLRRQLDDPHAAPCGRCDRCTGRTWPSAVSTAASTRAREELMRPGVVIEPRRMWPTGMNRLGISLSGRIPPTAGAEPGRVVARLGDVGWGNRLRPMFAAGPGTGPDDGPGRDAVVETGADGPLPADLVEAVVGTLAHWEWERRPAAVVAIASRSRPRLVSSLAERIAAIGRLPLLGQLERVGGGPHAGQVHNSAHRLAGLWEAFAVPPGLHDALGAVDGPILLVDDRIVTGWTMTVAARLLRKAGAPAVLPFALAVDTT